MKNDRRKAFTWPQEHRVVAQAACIGVAILGFVLAQFNFMTAAAAFVASLLAVIYIIGLTWHYIKREPEKHGDGRSV